MTLVPETETETDQTFGLRWRLRRFGFGYDSDTVEGMAPADVMGRRGDGKEGRMMMMMISCCLIACLCFCVQESFDLRAV